MPREAPQPTRRQVVAALKRFNVAHERLLDVLVNDVKYLTTHEWKTIVDLDRPAFDAYLRLEYHTDDHGKGR